MIVHIDRTDLIDGYRTLIHETHAAHVRIIGATSVGQLDDNLGALDFDVPHEELTEISSPPSHHPYNFFDRAASRAVPFMPDLDIRPQPR
ncbi:hypothetical protein ACFQ1S_45760 [Kibdelosporangium lantanae]|uniref:Uncharacterized protein n=1 Tax=Kibdelosporangium lantanae TaxID=1497396 RepID=A0ABW3MRX1_9PSEU